MTLLRKKPETFATQKWFKRQITLHLVNFLKSLNSVSRAKALSFKNMNIKEVPVGNANDTYVDQ